ncbi:probable 3',5'-cyclic phosphodiesterase pde-5 isoform X2 [Mizuhopecten yessoensis]|uniref:probable 3',5'-cyclic phosphodiesterase pde-5 isoform X2 n=1 Tax=Mizuhopecten yessoensis TaxID=6573 RepID=UPI000B45B337|nr:probable 3',5'-cyclic phosphodiesterase pde-5 isoform X2 [Mizuhopecten yessoensis]
MSSPVRQLQNRRLPPLPGAGPIRHNSASSETRYSSTPVPIRTESRYSGSKPKMHSGSVRSHLTSAMSYNSDISPDLVSQFLQENPEFLDNYVLNNVDETRVQEWSLRKTRSPRLPRQTWHLTNGDNREHFRDPQISQSKSRWTTTVQSNKWKVLHKLTKDFNLHTSRSEILTELSTCAKNCVNADGFNLYLTDEQKQLRYHTSYPTGRVRSSSFVGRTKTGMSLPDFVVLTRETIRLTELQQDPRYPKGLGVRTDNAQSVIVVPILDGKEGIMGVIEMFRYYGNIPFSSEDEEVAASLLVWADMFVEYVELYNSMAKQRKLNDFLLAVTKSIFQDIVSMDTVIMKIMNYAKKLGNADRASLFLLDSNTNELYARIFDTGKADEKVPQKEIRFPMDKGVAGFVATTGSILNIADAYNDSRFNRDVDQQTGYRTSSILCMPIYIRGSIIGVVQMVNKIDGNFNRADEESFETFAIYCGLALHHAKLYDKIRRSEQKFKVALDVLSYHSQGSEDEYAAVKSITIPMELPEIIDFDFSPWSVTNDHKPVYVLYMIKDIFEGTRYDINDIVRFTLTVRKNYRNVPYHNWAHAFSVAHAMFTVLKTAKHEFSPFESLALFVACLCHDLDHRGKTNAFMVKSASPLASIYSTSTMEHHHFNHTITILQNEGHNIFKHLSSEEYKHMLGDIRHCILATDLAIFFTNRARLQEIADRDEFVWDNREHRRLLMANCMTACDLCSMYKPWGVQLDLVYVIMEEFWQQGDEERSQGMTPMPMMDRQKQDELPHLEVGFLVGICLPCYELMGKILPETMPMANGAKDNLRRWKELAEQQKPENQPTGENTSKSQDKDEKVSDSSEKENNEKDKEETTCVTDSKDSEMGSTTENESETDSKTNLDKTLVGNKDYSETEKDLETEKTSSIS